MTTTPNMSIFVPSSGQELYSASFLTGMQNIDTHDHSGAPNNGVQIGTNGIQDGAITPDKLSFTLFVEADITTTNATPTNLDTVDIDEGQVITLQGVIAAIRDNGTESIGGSFTGTFRRPAGGNVLVVGVPNTNINEDSAGSPSFDLVANTGTQQIEIQVTGEGGKNINWKTQYSYVVNS